MWNPSSGTGHRLGGDSGETLQSPDERRKKDRRMNATNEMPEPASSGETQRSMSRRFLLQLHQNKVKIASELKSPPVRFRNAVTGKEFHLDPNTVSLAGPEFRSLEHYFRYIASLLKLHISAIRFVATNVDGDSCVITYKDQSFTLLTSLQKDSDENIWVSVMVDGTPTNQSES